MKNLNLKTLIPFVVGILIFVALTYGYFGPMLKGKMLFMSDMALNKGMAKEISDHRAAYNEEPLWTNSMFGGMPSYQISIRYPGNLMYPLRSVLSLGMSSPALMLFNYMFGFFILLLVLRVNPWWSIAGSIAYAFSAYGMIIIAAGHVTAAVAMGYFAPVFAGVILICRGKYFLGGALLTVFMSLELLANHIQNTYYLCIFLAIYVAFDWIMHVRKKEYMPIVKSLGIFILAGAIALSCNITNLWNTYDYAKYTIRGKSELSTNKDNKTSGLDRDYATNWSMGKAETMTLLIPSFKGTTNSMLVSENKDALKKVDPQMRDVVGNTRQYWGDQPFTDSPYAGAIVMFLFVFGLFIVEGRMKWVLLSAIVLSVMLSWGKNFMWLTDLFLDYFPMYNKFRAVSTMLLVAEFCIPILAVLAIDKLIKEPDIFKRKLKLAFSKKEISVQNAFFISFGLTGGLSLIFYLMPGLTDFSSISDSRIYDFYAKSNGAEVAQKIMDNIEIARIALFKADALRSFFFALLGGVAVWMYLKAKMHYGFLIAVLGILILADLWLVDKRHLNDKNFTDKKVEENPFPATTADKLILEDKENYRVLNLSLREGPFNDASVSFHHKSIGGYHAAKLRRYQELIDAHIINEMTAIGETLNTSPTDSAMRITFAGNGVLNMLNTRYFIYNPEAPPIRNRYALGNAWFVKDLKVVKNADEEIKELGSINPATTAVVDDTFSTEIQGFVPKPDPTAKIELASYKANHLVYTSETASEQVAVFSEIYYKDGWDVFVDGEQKSYFRVNYVLRAMKVPAGKHTIEFKFHPPNYYLGDKIALISSITMFVVVAFFLFMAWRRKELEG